MHQEMQIRSAASTDIMTEVTRPKRTLIEEGKKSDSERARGERVNIRLASSLS